MRIKRLVLSSVSPSTTYKKNNKLFAQKYHSKVKLVSTSNLDEKKTFILAVNSNERKEFISYTIEHHISKSVVFHAHDGSEALFKIENVPPHVCIIEGSLPKKNGYEVIEYLLSKDYGKHIAYIILSEIPDKEFFVDEVVTGQVQFLRPDTDEINLLSTLSRALNFVAQSDDSEYKLHFLAPNEILFNEGDEAQSVFILKTGKLDVYITADGNKKMIAQIIAGEFVGEMAYFNADKRSATVQAISDCELIEIPIGKLDMVLFSKPAWAKALMQTLTKRIKNANSLVKNILKKD